MSGVWVWMEINEAGHQADQPRGAGRRPDHGRCAGPAVNCAGFWRRCVRGRRGAFHYGADAVIAAEDATLAPFRVEAAGPLLVNLARDRAPSVILAGASVRGRDLTAWVAADLEAGLTPDGIAIAVDGDTVKVTRPVYAGKLLADVFTTAGTQVISLRSRAFAAAEETGGSGTPEMVPAVVAEDAIPSKVSGFESNEGKVSLTDAKIIVSGGRGVGGPEGFEPLRELAAVLGAAVGASRATVDAGWIPYEHQVGQTGKTVSPDLYIANGISGAIQHQAGMRTAKVIVAVNKDADAPIFKLAHYGIVGDLFTVVPALTAEFRKRLGQ